MKRDIFVETFTYLAQRSPTPAEIERLQNAHKFLQRKANQQLPANKTTYRGVIACLFDEGRLLIPAARWFTRRHQLRLKHWLQQYHSTHDEIATQIYNSLVEETKHDAQVHLRRSYQSALFG